MANFANNLNTSGATSNAGLQNSTISGVALGSNLNALTIGTGLSGSSYNGTSAVTIANTGVTSITAGTGISVSGVTGAVTVNNSQPFTGSSSQLAKAWVRYNGVTQTILASYNVSSVTYSATGTYVINWTTAFSNANYVLTGMCGDTAGATLLPNLKSTAPTTTSATIYTVYSVNNVPYDSQFTMIAAFGT